MSPTIDKANGPEDSSQYLGRFKAGEYIFRETERGTEMFIIQQGKVEILKMVHGEERRVALLEEGDFFGEMAILEDLPRSASARAVADCALLCIDNATFDQMVRHHPEIPVRMLRKLSSRLREASPHTEVDAAPASLGRAAARPAKPVPSERPTSTPRKPIPEAPKPAAPAAKAAPRVPATPLRPRFVHEPTGTDFLFGEATEIFVGRFDATTGFQPEIDLREVDTDRSTSRRHARVVRRDNRYFLREEIGTANGTFVAGERIATGVDVELSDGDEVKFGRVRMVFHTT
ncbi:MAG: cyclic nucleotide-binding domain-containing protein [Acidobacteriia bacterium]|nr:cyclic nucleotide-binding domain-containing protein [Terriglobia bacterium]